MTLKKQNDRIRLACSRLLEVLRGSYYRPTPNWNRELHLADIVQKAQKHLDDYKAGRAAWTALDILMPGWVDIDFSDDLPPSVGTFISNDKQEWVDWLVSRGLTSERAQEMVDRDFADRMEA